MDFTTEQQAHIDNLIAEKTKGLYSEDELQRRVTSEVDRRVESGIQKGLETYKNKWEKEFQERAMLTAEELAKKELDEQMGLLSKREAEITKRANLIEAKDTLTNANIPREHYEKFMDLLITDNTEMTQTNVNNFIESFNATKIEIESKLKKEMSTIPSPSSGTTSNGGINKNKLSEMTYMERLELKQKDEELYNQLNK